MKKSENAVLSSTASVLHATKEGDIQMIQNFIKKVQTPITQEMQHLFNSCVNICIENGNMQLMCIFLDNGASPDGDTQNTVHFYIEFAAH